MEDSTKETVIIVHGTYAEPMEGTRRWYQPSGGVHAGKGFVEKLDDALEERGSFARCWAHCSRSNQIFKWSGKNGWIERTHAASKLGDYVTSLRNIGWRCHIVAHSHGGNVVVEAMPRLIAAPRSNAPPGTIVTLGTPFVDTKSPILQAQKRIISVANALVPILIANYTLLIVSGIYTSTKGFFSKTFVPSNLLLWIILIFFSFLCLIIGIAALLIYRKNELGAPLSNEAAGTYPPFLAISSPMDEAWQILHHMHNIPNPLAVDSGLIRYLFSACCSRMSQIAQVERIAGAAPFRELSVTDKLKTIVACFGIFSYILIGVTLPLFLIPNWMQISTWIVVLYYISGVGIMVSAL
ncbi:MAG: hypothetical protein ACRDHW_20010, partial [Ktedonobacteraceae bacterium]